MAAASYSSDVLQSYYGRIGEDIQSLPQPLVPRSVPRFDGFQITQNNFQDWLRVWRMDVSETNPNRRDIFNFAGENREKFTRLVEQSILELRNVKIGFGLEVKFSIERDGEIQTMKHYFKSNRPLTFNRYDGDEEIREKIR